METKQCSNCKEVKSLSEFGMRSKTSKYRNSRCKPCHALKTNESRARYRKENLATVRVSQRKHYYKHRYGLSLEDHAELVKNGCDVCGSMERLCIDHDHSCCASEFTCGKCIRGVLCDKHNKMLGYCKDSVEELLGLVAYLTR